MATEFFNFGASNCKPSGCPAVWLDAEGQAVIDPDLYSMLDEDGKRHLRAAAANLELEHAERLWKRATPPPTIIPIEAIEALTTATGLLISSEMLLEDFMEELRETLKACDLFLGESDD